MLVASCAAQRSLTVTSEPPGAAVRLADEVIGETPVTVDFVHYGPRRITLYREGFRTDSRRVTVDPPWYARFPLDIVSEVLLPIGWKDHHRIHFVLERGTPGGERPDLRSVQDRAEVLRRAGPDGPQDLPPVFTVPTERGEATPADPNAATESPRAAGAAGSPGARVETERR